MDVIPRLHEKLFSVTLELKKWFQVMSEGKSLILKKKTTKISFDKKTSNTGGNEFILTNNIYK